MASLNKGVYLFDEPMFFNYLLSGLRGFDGDFYCYDSNDVIHYFHDFDIDKDAEQIEYDAQLVYDNSQWNNMSLCIAQRIYVPEIIENVDADVVTFIELNTTQFNFTLSYDTNGGDLIPSTIQVWEITSLPTPTKSGYRFLGWYYDNGTFANAVSVGDYLNDDTIIYAKWEQVYNIQFNSNGGSVVSSIVDNVLPTPLPTTTRSGYVFEGWYYDDVTFTTQAHSGDVITQDTILYAKWRELYDLSFDSDGGTSYNTLVDIENIPLDLYTNYIPTKEGFEFDGWYFESDYETRVLGGETLTANTTIYAKYEFEGTMYADLYTNDAEENVVNKWNYLSNKIHNEIFLLEPTSMLNPSIKLKWDETYLPSQNYAYIPKFQRFYFITDIIILRNGYIQINLKVDVLMSFRNIILGTNAIIKRQEYDNNPYLIDENIPTQNNNIIDVIDITDSKYDDTKSDNNDINVYVMEIGGDF
ncbi:MAG: InlB B-repeat-containing protein [Bacilli bacterium]|nr:InlB B-repeat-containing protein [Bacilli bacterium]